MIRMRRSKERGYFDHGWLETAHTFSFGGYRDEAWMGFGPLRVINEDFIAPKMGFGEHGHRDMEIITYPVSGAVRHRDSLGNEEDIVHGMIQRMSAGSGIRHSEFNPLDERTHMLQIWIEPRDVGLAPTHESKAFAVLDEPGRLHLLASGDGSGGSLKIEQDARLSAGVFEAGDSVRIEIASGRRVWVQVIAGSVSVLGEVLEVGDGAGISDEGVIEFGFDEASEILIFELA
jgi:quercetin 2,3-dioxygenase